MEARTNVRRGRPRDPERHEAILAATRDLLPKVGYADLTIEGVAARAGVGKATIYRRWSSKGLLVWEAVIGKSMSAPLPGSGDTEADLTTILGWGVDELSAPEAQAALPGMLAEFQSKPELERAVLQEVIEPEYGRVRTVFERAVERGDLRADLDLDLVMDAMIGTVFVRAVLLNHPLDESLITGLADLLLSGARPHEGARGSR